MRQRPSAAERSFITAMRASATDNSQDRLHEKIKGQLRNGTIDYSGKYDPTSREKDRILPEGSARTVEELASLVLYRDGEAVS